MILVGMASRQLEDGAVDAALANLRDAVTAAPDLAEAQYARARGAARPAPGSEAEDALLSAVRLDPGTRATATSGRGCCSRAAT